MMTKQDRYLEQRVYKQYAAQLEIKNKALLQSVSELTRLVQEQMAEIAQLKEKIRQGERRHEDAQIQYKEKDEG